MGAAPQAGEKYAMACPVCGHADAALDYKLSWKTNSVAPFFGCFRPACQDLGGNYLEAVGQALGLDPGAQKEDIADAWIAAWEEEHQGSLRPGGNRPPEQLPSARTVAGWQAHLRRAPAAMAYLHDQRGLTTATVRRYCVGYAMRGGCAAFALPVYDADGQLVNVKFRLWPHQLPLADGSITKAIAVRGRPAALYPDVPRGRAVLLCEGEFDALLARQHGLPALTSTAGTSWDHSWDHLLAGKRVAILYDAGASAYSLARSRARQLAGPAGPKGQAWPVDLSRAGLQPGEDLTDYFIKYRHSAGDLLALVRAAKEDA
jgi:hypothetical protein